MELFSVLFKLILVGGDVQVDDKTISRKHMTVEVEDVKPGACVSLECLDKDLWLIFDIGKRWLSNKVDLDRSWR